MNRNYKLSVLNVILLLTLASGNAYSASPVCHTHPSGNYCSYTGLVNKIYINKDGVILLYFDTPIDVGAANSFDMNITNGGATAYRLNDNPEFAKLLYSTALAAQATNRPVSLQMRGNYGAYLKFDRIWLGSPK